MFLLDMLTLIKETITLSQDIESEPVTHYCSIISQQKRKLKNMSFYLKSYHQYIFQN